MRRSAVSYTVCSMIELTRVDTIPRDPQTEQDGARLAVLRLLTRDPELSQRDMARALGVSLGKTHYLLRAMLDRGLVKAHNFRRSDNKIAYAYVLTPRGMSEKMRITRSFLKRKEAEFVLLRGMIADLRREVQVGEP
jgi:EPS-associated MarR family transcriptional regulator